MYTTRLIDVRSALLAVSAAAWLGGCASTPVPTTELAVAEAAVKRASTSSTSENAPAELQLATDKLASARQAVASKDYERARQLADEAQVDAQVAELRAQSNRSRKAATESHDAARALGEELPRQPARGTRGAP